MTCKRPTALAVLALVLAAGSIVAGAKALNKDLLAKAKASR